MIDYRAPLDELPDPLPIVPLEKPFDVTIRPPGSKSITNRAYVLAALAEGESRIIRPLRSEDTDGLLDALCALGAEARWVPGEDGDDVFIKGVAGRFPRGGSVNLGDGGTPTRFMIAAACLAAEPVIVDGSPRMRDRPIAEGVEMLRKLGATIEYVEEEGRLPVRVVPSEDFKGGELTIGKTASSQFISALLLIGPWLERGIRVTFEFLPTSKPYVVLTQDVMVRWQDDLLGHLELMSMGVDSVGVESVYIQGACFAVEPDASSAVYFLVAAALCRSGVRIKGLANCSSQPDAQVARCLDREVWSKVFRADEKWLWSDMKWPIGDAPPAAIRMLHVDAGGFPDGAMAVAVAAVRGSGKTQVTGLHTLRVKETDRIAALANELRKVGCTVETTDDSITITPPARGIARDVRAATARERSSAEGSSRAPLPDCRGSDQIMIETYNDHRMAMSFAVLGLVRPGIAIANPKCVAKSYPTFWQDFAKLYESTV